MNSTGEIKNLRSPWKPGQSGNPAGRPRKRPLSDAYLRVLESPAPADMVVALRQFGIRPGARWADILAVGMVKAAAHGDAAAAKEITNRLEGRVPVAVQIDSDTKVNIAVSFEAPPGEVIDVEPEPEALPEPEPAKEPEKP